jgi:hypothetical protein
MARINNAAERIKLGIQYNQCGDGMYCESLQKEILIIWVSVTREKVKAIYERWH